MNKPKEQVVHVEYDVAYLPTPNTVEVVITSDLAPAELTKTAFMVPVCDDGGIIIAVNQRRGLEIAGGHIEADETAEDAAFREAFEETGTTVSNVTPIGFLRMTSKAAGAPEGYAYPFPISYQQFFAGSVENVEPYTDNDECSAPVKIYDTLDRRITRKSITLFGNAALKTVLGYLG